MKQDEQQKNGGQPDEEPADPTSAAARSDSALSIFAHESDTLISHPPIATALLCALTFWTNGLASLTCASSPFAAGSTILAQKFLTADFADLADEVNDLQESS